MDADPKIESPPPKGGRSINWDWTAVARMVEEANGEWVFINDGLGPVKTSLRYALERGNMAAMRPVEKFEYTTRNNTPPSSPGGRTCDLYVRINPDYKEN